MLNVNDIRDNKEEYIRLLKIKNFDASSVFEILIRKDNDRKLLQQKNDELLFKANKLAKEIGALYKEGKKLEADELKAKSLILKKKTKELHFKKESLEKEIYEKLKDIPNIPHSSVTNGETEKDNVIIKESGKIPILVNNALPHWQLASKYNLIDFELGNKITGSGFPVYIDKGAKLQRSLISYFLDKNINAGYKEFIPPHLVNEDSAFGTGQLPDKDDQMYHVKLDNLYLIPTAEVPITNLFRNQIIDQNSLPIKCTSFTPCFRREAGSYGKDVRGLNRLHQFDKVEIVQLQTPEKSYQTLDEMVNHVSNILDELDLPYRIVKLCGGDLSFTSSLTYDFEVYSAAQKRWLEVSSVSNFENYQSNRLKLRYKDKNGKKYLCHTLNGSALALPRIFAAILENYQTEKGIIVPKVLQSYMDLTIIN